MLLVLVVISGILFAPLLVKVIAYGFESTNSKFELTVFLTRLMFPYIFLISLVALCMGILNSLKRFASPAASPILLNLSIVFGAVVLTRYFTESTIAVAIGVLVGGMLQLLLQVPFLIKEGMLPRLNFNWRHPALKSLTLLMLPSVYGAAVYQINVLVITLLASFLPNGSVSYLWYADRLSEFPLGIFSIAVATATLPTLADHVAKKDMISFRKTTNFSLRLAFLIDLPAAAGLFMLSELIVNILFQRGRFSHEATIATANALKMFTLGIPFVSGVRNLVPAFFALKSPKIPVLVATVALIVNAIMATILMQYLLHCGLALSLSISAIVNFLLLIILFRRKVGRIYGRIFLKSILRTIFATSIMVVFIFVALKYIDPASYSNFFYKFSGLILMIGMSCVLYIAIIRTISKDEYSAIKAMIQRKKNLPSACSM